MASASIQIHGFTTTTLVTSRETLKFTSSNSLFFGSTRTANSARLIVTEPKARRTGTIRAVAEKVMAVDEVEKMREKMVNDAERFAKEEKERRNSIYAKKHADSVVYKTENQLKNAGQNVPPSTKDKIEAKLGELKDATSNGIAEPIKDAITAVNKEVMQISDLLSLSSSSATAAAEIKVTAKNMHVSVFKARRVLEQIRGRTYEDALMILELMPYRASYPILKLVYSASANGTHNLDLKESDAYIKRAEANDGPFVKKMRPRARGRSSVIKKLTSHITIVMGWRNT